jgi:hypothetical protein
MSNEKYLSQLIGKSLASTAIDTSTIFGINQSNEDSPNGQLIISNILYFESYSLHIYNPISISPSDKELEDLVGHKVIATDERAKEAELAFDNGYMLLINMQDEVYYGPESMCLYGPNNFLVVWN